jgi:hypothetical protein
VKVPVTYPEAMVCPHCAKGGTERNAIRHCGTRPTCNIYVCPKCLYWHTCTWVWGVPSNERKKRWYLTWNRRTAYPIRFKSR